MNIVALISVIFAEILLIESILSADTAWPTDVNRNITAFEPNGLRFQRILRRKKRFLLFPPGAAIVTTMSFTKTLVPRSPSGINTIGEVDIFYPLQNKIEDWYPTKKPIPPPPPPSDEEDENEGVLPNNVGPQIPPNIPQPPPPPPPPPPIAQNDQPTNDNPPPGPINVGTPFLPTPANLPDGRLPTDQEIGITPGTIISDPNFDVGTHPGEIYVDKNGNQSQKIPPRRFFSEYSKYSTSSWPHQQYNQYESSWNPTSNSKGYNDWKTYNDRYYSSYGKKQSQNRVNVQTMQKENSIYSNTKENAWRYQHRDAHPFESNYRGYSNNYYNRAARERRDIFDQLESFMSFKQFDTKSCILRMICEAKHYLLPPGKSLFQDIFRILFTLPPEDEVNDEYARATQATEEDCDTIYSEKCRFSVLGFLMSKDRPIL
ncbi:formin-like protein 7 [Contarinia nasturtii]|uniref:formin-like protein 7 n=1 Tax=Contarinia nasturtii TaxID=265458 RepID=UPI0012D3CCF4|nr:formin-like protein 7 [Contarinia nasturtii]